MRLGEGHERGLRTRNEREEETCQDETKREMGRVDVRTVERSREVKARFDIPCFFFSNPERNFFIRIVASAAASPPGAALTRLFLRLVRVSSMNLVRELDRFAEKRWRREHVSSAGQEDTSPRGKGRERKKETNLIVAVSIPAVFS